MAGNKSIKKTFMEEKKNKLLNSLDKIFAEGKEQKLKIKLAQKIKNKLFTGDILDEINECDITDFLDEDDHIVEVFESIFPIEIKADNSIFRLFKHKIEVDLSDNIKDRFIYMFSDGRFIGGNFECYGISDREYVYGVEKIINAVPEMQTELIKTLKEFKASMDGTKYKIEDDGEKIELAKSNYEKLKNLLEQK